MPRFATFLVVLASSSLSSPALALPCPEAHPTYAKLLEALKGFQAEIAATEGCRKLLTEVEDLELLYSTESDLVTDKIAESYRFLADAARLPEDQRRALAKPE